MPPNHPPPSNPASYPPTISQQKNGRPRTSKIDVPGWLGRTLEAASRLSCPIASDRDASAWPDRRTSRWLDRSGASAHCNNPERNLLGSCPTSAERTIIAWRGTSLLPLNHRQTVLRSTPSMSEARLNAEVCDQNIEGPFSRQPVELVEVSRETVGARNDDRATMFPMVDDRFDHFRSDP